MSSIKNKGLGKGLEALFGDVEIGDNSGLTMVDIHKIKPNSLQPREDFKEESINELAESIKAHGIIQPIILRQSDKGYEIVAGERRWRAAHKAGLKEVPAVVRELTNEQNAFMVLVENMQREDLNSIEEAKGLERLVEDYGLTQDAISKSVGKSRPYVANALRLLKLPEKVQEMISSGDLTGGHGKAIAGIKDPKEQTEVAEKSIKNSWSVRELENYLKGSKDKLEPKKRKPTTKKAAEIKAVEEDLKTHIGAKVKIRGSGNKGRIEIEYYSRSELERLIEFLSQSK